MSAAHGQRDATSIQRYVSSALAILSLIAAIAFVLTAVFLWVSNASPIVTTVLLTFIVGVPGALFFQFLFAIQRVPQANAIQIAGAALSVCCAVAGITMQIPQWGVALAYAAPPVVVTYAWAAAYFFRNPSYRPSFMLVDFPLGRDLLRLGSQFFVLSILMAASLNIDNIVVATQISPDAVASYSIPMRIGSLLTLLVVAITMPMWGANGEAIAKKEYDWVQRNAARTSMLGAAIVTIAGIFLVLISDWIIQLWVGRNFEDQKLVISGFVMLSIATAITSPFNMVLNALGKVKVQVCAWALFLAVTVLTKLLIASVATWALSAVGALAYAVIILPIMMVGSRRALEKARADNP